MSTRKPYTPQELRELADEPLDAFHPHLLDAMRAALRFCADVIDAANEAPRTAPAPRQAPLTEAQAGEIWRRPENYMQPLNFARAIEAAHGIIPAGGEGEAS